MKIIRDGKIKEIEITESCKDCKCVFVYTSSDVIFDQRDGDYVKCPTCKKFIASKI